MLIEVACDESGSEGEKLVGGVTDVFAHASVGLRLDVAEACVLEIRDRIRSPAEEYKANHLLRDKHRGVLVWLLGESGPIIGRSHVHLVDKTAFLVGRMVELLVEDPVRGLAATLHRDGPRVFGAPRWSAFLDSFNNVARVRNRRGNGASVDDFFRDLDHLLRFDTAEEVREILATVARGRDRVEDYRGRLSHDVRVVSVLDPMVSAIVRTVAFWSTGGTVFLVHDEQLSLTDLRIAQLVELCRGRLAGVRLVDSRLDARVQVADFLAGIARRIASDELNGHGDDELVALLRPYVAGPAAGGGVRSGG